MSNEQKVTRKLRAIFSADVKGYSILMADDEVATIQTLKDYRNIMSACIEQSGGRVVDAVGDNLLAEFDSAVDAVQCAVEVQKELKVKNQELPDHKKLEFRIGINIGDVIDDGGRLFGDGVNVAARIEGLADAGGICVSRSTYDQIKNKLKLSYDYLGEHEVKNIKEPVRVYKVLLDKESQKPLVDESFEIPEKPSIAVLPFDNMSDDPGQEYFSDGITEDIITDLSKVSGIFVVARNSSFFYKGKQVKVQQIAEELKVQYLLEGSIRRAGDRLRITVQLIDANTGHHLWAERYDRELKDIFAVQDEVTQKVVSELAVSLTAPEIERLERRHTNSFEAYELLLRARREAFGLKKENYLKSKELAEQVIELDPNFAGGYGWLASILGMGVRYGWSISPSQDVEKAFQMAQKAVSVDASYWASYFGLADSYMMMGKHDDAISAIYKAISIHPNDAMANLFLGWYLHWAGRGQEAIEAIKKARQLEPMYQFGQNPAFLDFMGAACFTAGLYEASVTNWEKSIDRYGPKPVRQAFITASYSELGRLEQAIAMAQELVKTDPEFSVSSWDLARMYKNPMDTERLLNALRKAGLK